DALVTFAGAWSRAGVILFGQPNAGLLRISETGGEVKPVTPYDSSRQEIDHRYPTFLPDGDHFLYTIQSGRKETRGVYLGSLDGTLKRRLLDTGSNIRYMGSAPGATPGWLVYRSGGPPLPP